MRYLKQAWLVLALALVFGALLAGVQAKLGPKIEENKRNETFDQIPGLVGADAAEVSEVRTWSTEDGKVAYEAVGDAEQTLGWVIKGAGKGFADKIEVLIGLDAETQTLTGLFVLDQKETPALGDNIKKPEFCDRFRGKSAAEALAVVKSSPEGNQIQAITGATVSSDAVCTIVNKAVEQFREHKSELTLEQ